MSVYVCGSAVRPSRLETARDDREQFAKSSETTLRQVTTVAGRLETHRDHDDDDQSDDNQQVNYTSSVMSLFYPTVR